MTPTILIVDDTPENLRLLNRMLSGHGYRVRSASSGAGALTSIQKESPDLILLDIMMPEMDGLEVCQRLKANKHTQDIPIIFISALNRVFEKVEALRVGGVDYITKPFEIEEVLARVDTHLTLRRLQTSLQEKNEQLQAKNEELEAALSQVKLLSGLLPICAHCKNIRDDKGYWQKVEVYIRDHSEAEFSHGLCPNCMQELYPAFYEKYTRRRQEVVAVLKEMGRADYAAIVARVNFSERHLLNCLEMMVDDKQAKVVEMDGQTFYELV